MHERSDLEASGFVRLNGAERIAPGTARAYSVGRREIALFNVDGELYALENSCPHQGAPIADGWMEGPIVVCPWHAWCFDVRTGKMTLGEFAMIDRYEVRRENGRVYVGTEPLQS